VVQALRKHGLTIPVLRKDFLIHPIQLAESAAMGADAVLLIASVLGPDLSMMIEQAHAHGLETLVEIESAEDLAIALEAKASIIGVNHRSLKTFDVDGARSASLYSMIPKGIVTVAESGIKSIEDAHRMRSLGYDAILVGEYLVKASDPSQLIQKMKRGHQ
jgi:indole-3-glycerol phosphate synthase